ncbi:MAG TPA: STAS domain-containing protein [bacterium]|nr:STAS domain-containing protein [bacterium]
MTTATLRIERDMEIPVVYVQGEIDIVNASHLGAQLFDAAPNDAPGMVVDLSGVTYLDSRGLHLLFELSERLRVRDQRLHLVIPTQGLIRRVLTLTRMDAVVPLYASVPDAVRQMSQTP